VILQFLVDTLINVLETILSVLPTVPAMPSSIVTAGTWITDQIGNSIAFLNMIYGTTLLSAIMIAVVAMFTFEWVYHTTLWVIHKVPIIGID
jgi:hypothetical protein